MGELARAMKILGNLPEHQLIQNQETGRWFFVGRCYAAVMYQRKDGTMPSAEELENAARFGPMLAGLEHRTYGSKEEALQFLASVE